MRSEKTLELDGIYQAYAKNICEDRKTPIALVFTLEETGLKGGAYGIDEKANYAARHLLQVISRVIYREVTGKERPE